MGLELQHVNLIDGTGKLIQDAIVVTDGSRITAAGPRAGTAIPPGTRDVIDATGMTLMPGLWDLHAHLHGQGEADEHIRHRYLNETNAYLAVILAENGRRTLEAGFTTIRDMGAPNDINIDVSRAIADSILKGPRVIPVATIDMTYLRGSADVHGTHGNITGPVEAQRLAREKIAAGAEVIHVKATGAAYGQYGPQVQILSEEEMRGAIAEAHKLGKRTTAHACGSAGMKNAVKAGVECIEHGQWLYEDPELIKMMADRQVAWVPTLMNNVTKLDIMRESQAKGVKSGLADYVEKRVVHMVEPHRRSFEKAMEAGIPCPIGTDVGAPFTPNGTNARELEMYVRYGASPMQAIELATRVSAQVLRMSDWIGTVEPGKEADLLLVKTDPLKDIRTLQDKNNIALVIQGGQIVIDRRDGAVQG